MKKRIAVVCLLLLVLFAGSALASTPVHGRVRIYGCKDEVNRSDNMFAPYAVYKNIPHVKDQYLEFAYNKLNSYERSWSLWMVNEKGELKRPKGRLLVYLPYPSIWSEEKGEYWKWTKTYAQKHYQWRWAVGSYKEMTDTYVTYTRDEYRPFNSLGTFGPCVDTKNMPFYNGITYFVECN